MKVRELIEALQALPKEAEVLHLWDGAARTAINHVWLARNGAVVTADDDMVCYDEDSRPIYDSSEFQDSYWFTPIQY